MKHNLKNKQFTKWPKGEFQAKRSGWEEIKWHARTGTASSGAEQAGKELGCVKSAQDWLQSGTWTRFPVIPLMASRSPILFESMQYYQE